jgi:hypothetical protein
VDRIARPPLTTDLTRWRRLVVSGKEWGAIQNMDDSRTRYILGIDEMKKTVGFKKRVDPKFQASLQYATPDEHTFLLISRGFHWINDEPFNR